MKKDKRIKRKKRLQRKKKHKQILVQKNSEFIEMTYGANMENPSFIMVKNNETELIGTNYWETESAHKGLFYLSINAGAFRILVPETEEKVIEEFKTGEYCIISKGPSQTPSHPFAIELLFEDHTKTPYFLLLCAGQVDRNPSSTDAGHKNKLSVWTKGCKKVLEMDAYFRVVNKFPCLKPLGKEFKNVS